ncbi:MAG: hypothetical protein AAB336_01230 [Acidobacteriota bacterium]
MTDLTEPIQKEIKTEKEDFGVNIILGFITSMLGLVTIGFVFLEGNIIFERIIDHIPTINLGLQILPIVLSLIAQKSSILRNYWIPIFWLTTLFELIIFTVVMVITNPN